MYARYWFRYVAKAGVGAALLRLLRVCQAVLLWVTPGALGSVWLFNGRTRELPEKATLYLRCESRRMLLRTEGAFGVSVDRNYSSRAWHLELEICVVRHRIELCECGFSEQGVIATANGTISKINSSLRKLSGDPKTTSSVTEPVQLASTPGITPLKVVLVGLILEGSMPISRTVS